MHTKSLGFACNIVPVPKQIAKKNLEKKVIPRKTEGATLTTTVEKLG